MEVLYDFSYFLKPEAENAAEQIKSAIKKINGAIIEENAPFRKNLSYPILKYREGLFGSIKFSADEKNINSLNEILKKEGDILRFMLKKEVYKEIKRFHRRKTPPSIKKEKPVSATKEQIADIDKKLEEILKM